MTEGPAPVRAVEAHAYRVPTDAPEGDGALHGSATTVVVVRVRAADVVGLGWTYAHATGAELVRSALATAIEGRDALHILACWQRMQRAVRNEGRPGPRRVREAVEADVAAGEYGHHLPHFAGMLDADAVDCLQVGITRCGGFGGWFRVAALAAARNRAVSGPCAQNFAAHAAVATSNVRHLEWFHDHERIERMFFDGVLAPTGGRVRPGPSAPGHGMTSKESDVERYRVA